jgi:hypothetical protein
MGWAQARPKQITHGKTCPSNTNDDNVFRMVSLPELSLTVLFA